MSTGGFSLAFASHASGAAHGPPRGQGREGPFGNIGGKRGPHIHHMTFGIISLLVVG